MERITISQLTFGPDYKGTSGVTIEQLLKSALTNGRRILETDKSGLPVLVHSEIARKIMHSHYGPREIGPLAKLVNQVSRIEVHPRGIVLAANRPGSATGEDPMHYDAVWIRDSLWAYLGLRSQGRGQEGKKVLLTLLDYLATPHQLRRLSRVITSPDRLNGPQGMLEAVHIRFDAKSPEFKDVIANGKPQHWNHKQNDALGLLLDLSLRAVQAGELNSADLSGKHYTAIACLIAYLGRIRFFEMEDAGSWEEIERINTSSVALVTSGLERLDEILETQSGSVNAFAKKLHQAAKELSLQKHLSRNNLRHLLKKGYDRILKQLEAGGESPLYGLGTSKHRGPDAALLNLIYPARLRKLPFEAKRTAIELVSTLVGGTGIKRYLGDSYQSGNFWYNTLTISTKAQKNKTRSECDFIERRKIFIPGTEAEWFFDSWYSHTLGLLYRETGIEDYHCRQIEFFNRALGQITGGTPRNPVLGADGNPVAPLALPESYNTVVSGTLRAYVPSPITPLNWSKACLSIAFAGLTGLRHQHTIAIHKR
jgi:hypothetical protein